MRINQISFTSSDKNVVAVSEVILENQRLIEKNQKLQEELKTKDERIKFLHDENVKLKVAIRQMQHQVKGIDSIFKVYYNI